MRSLQRLSLLSAHLLRAPTAASSRPLLPDASKSNTVASYSSASSSSTNYKVTKKDRAFYPYALDIQSRWADNDQYGHLNNAHYYALFDTVINTFLIQETGLDPHNDHQGNSIGVVAESGCQYFSSLSFPDMIEARLAVIKLGRSSVVYQVGIFKKLAPSEGLWKTTPGSSPISAGVFSKAATSILEPVDEADNLKVFHASQLRADVAATGHFCHVFVDKVSRRPVPIPEKIRAGLEMLQVKP
ncbi:MAG: HotDog domain-containing protein [Benniella sp.]|nr:MAG: HotDog domain-containing protein [Benniella sp.]